MGGVGETRGKQRWMGGRNWRETEMDGGEWERLEGNRDRRGRDWRETEIDGWEWEKLEVNRDRWGRVGETGGRQIRDGCGSGRH